LAQWSEDTERSGIYTMQRFAKTLRRDQKAVRNVLKQLWSNGQTEG
jgi:transposase